MTQEVETEPSNEPNSTLGAVEWICISICLVWLALGIWGALELGMLSAETDALTRIMTAIAIIFPVAIIAMVAAAARHQRTLRHEAQMLRTTVGHLQKSIEVEARARRAAQGGEMEEKIEAIAKSTAQTETALATFVSARSDRPKRITPTAVRSIDVSQVEATAEAAGEKQDLQNDLFEHQNNSDDPKDIDVELLITALHFPSDADDKDAFAALRKALDDRRYRPLVYAAQDVLTRLAKDEIYMDSVSVDRARPEVWRKFAEGERGPLVSAAGGIRDRKALALASRAIKADPNFRDTAHQFVQKFDSLMTDISAVADDAQIVRLTNTRSARAFMLLGRVLGLFS